MGKLLATALAIGIPFEHRSVLYAQEMETNKLFFIYALLLLLLLLVRMALHLLRCHVLCWPVPQHIMQVPHHKLMCVFSRFPTWNP